MLWKQEQENNKEDRVPVLTHQDEKTSNSKGCQSELKERDDKEKKDSSQLKKTH